MTKFVQISGSKVITEYFCPQDPTDKPGYAEIENDDPRYLDFISPPWSPRPLLEKTRVLLDTNANRLSIIAGRAYRAGDTTTAMACDKAIGELLQPALWPGVTAADDATSLASALSAAYAEIISALPTDVQGALEDFYLVA